jgi:hypothetical protein
MRQVTIALLSMLAACATAGENGRDAVMSRAASDLGCPAQGIQVLQLGDRMFGARGCGKKATYVTNRCWSGDYEGCKATLDSGPSRE